MIDVYTRKTKFALLKAYCHLSGPDAFMEVVEWHNGEGFDVFVSERQRFSLTWGQYDALQALVHYKGKPDA